jgi:hypothetical protein
MSAAGPDFRAGFVAPALANNADIGCTIASLLKVPVIWNAGHREGRWRSMPGQMPVGAGLHADGAALTYPRRGSVTGERCSGSAAHVVTLRPIAGTV